MRIRLLKSIPLVAFLFVAFQSPGQKKPLDHSVYDAWQSIGENLISPDGKWIVYTVQPQEGDATLYVKSNDGNSVRSIERGYQAVVTEDSRFLIFRIKAPYKDIREARIKKKKPEDFPKDSLGILALGKDELFKTATVKNFRVPKKSSGWVVYHREKAPVMKKASVSQDRRADSLQRVIDSLERLLQAKPEREKKKKGKDDAEDPAGDIAQYADGDEGAGETGSDLVVRSLSSGSEEIFNNVLEYALSAKGNKLLIKQAKDPSDPAGRLSVSIYDLQKGEFLTILRGGNDFRNLTLSDDGTRAALVAERDSRSKDPVKYYKLWYYEQGWDTARSIADRYSVGMPIGNTVSEFATISFSTSGNRLLFGTAPNPIPKDTSMADIDIPKLDIWHYNDDYLQTVQTLPSRLRAAQQQSFTALIDTRSLEIQQLGCREIPQVLTTGQGDGNWFYGLTDVGKRVAAQWEGGTLRDLYAINPSTGEHRLLAKNISGNFYPSADGSAIAWYDRTQRSYFAWDGKKVKNISSKVAVPLWNEENDVPADPNNYGVMGWHEGDSAFYVFDMYDLWKLDVKGTQLPVNITKGTGRRENVSIRYVQTDDEKRSFTRQDVLLFATQNRTDKKNGLRLYSPDGYRFSDLNREQPFQFGSIRQAREARGHIIYTKESFNQSPDIYFTHLGRDLSETHHDLAGRMPVEIREAKLSSLNPQQSSYLWGSAELFRWKAYNGKEATGILYKPENYDPKKKYPMIVYFYEKLSNTLYDYKEPAPIRSAVNIPFFVSRGYVLFLPDIIYEKGRPGRSAYDYVVSGARAVAKTGLVDSNRIAIQGHSWGGYQAAQLATMTPLFRAVWAGAPVANMTSAYGGIRWETGLSRQFQYEKTQSRLGVTPWDNLAPYIENSPLFHLQKVKAPMVIMHNDADGAVPWYQGIELFTALRRLGKKVWMFNYNGQGHGLTQRQDMRDYHIRMQQFFDWILKGESPARWITDGVPAVEKGKDLGY